MVEWSDLQEQVLGEFLIADITVKNTTPVIIGGYNAKPYSRKLNLMEEPRPTEIKGLWRWWARALVSGVLFSEGKAITIDEADKIISYVLGGTTEEGTTPSKITLKVKVLNMTSRLLNSDEVDKIPRLKLLKMKAKEAFDERFYVYDDLKLRIGLYAHEGINPKDVPSYKFAFASLILSLIFSGIGAITNRAFGSLMIEIENLKLGNKLIQHLGHYLNIIRNIYGESSIENIKSSLWSLISNSLKDAREYVGSISNVEIQGQRSLSLPLMPSIVMGNSNVFRLEIKPCRAHDVIDLLGTIGNSVLKQAMKQPCYGINKRRSGVNIHTFILGLPRSSKTSYGNIELRTGYIVSLCKTNHTPSLIHDPREAKRCEDSEKTGKLRRLSTIGFTVLRRDSRPLVLVYGMLAEDINEIKKDIVHRGVIGKPGRKGYVRRVIDTPLCNVDIIREFNRLWNCIVNVFLRRC